MLYVKISGRKTGNRVPFFSGLKQQGQQTEVPCYQAELGCMKGSFPIFRFSVTRDVRSVVFQKNQVRFDTKGECPPNRICAPYHALIHDAPRNGFSLRLFEERCLMKQYLHGTAEVERTEILIHNGSGTSDGCFGITSSDTYRQLQELLKEKLPNEQTELLVFVDPRPETDHLIHLT